MGGSVKKIWLISLDYRRCYSAWRNETQRNWSSCCVGTTSCSLTASYPSTANELAGLRTPVSVPAAAITDKQIFMALLGRALIFNKISVVFFCGNDESYQLWRCGWLVAPPYHLRHSVQPAPWSFLDLACDDTGENSSVAAKSVRFADLSTPPPYHLPPEGFQVNHLFRNIYDTNLCNSFGIVTIPNYSFPLFANLELSH